jgi:hypothetical protein
VALDDIDGVERGGWRFGWLPVIRPLGRGGRGVLALRWVRKPRKPPLEKRASCRGSWPGDTILQVLSIGRLNWKGGMAGAG